MFCTGGNDVAAGRTKLQRLFSTFPSGRPGVALFLLRAVVAAIAAAQAFSCLSHSGSPMPDGLVCLLLAACVAFLLLGFLTPVVSLLAAGLALEIAFSWLPVAVSGGFAGRLASGEWIAIAVALALLGPGAYSLDAFFFGRHEIEIPPMSRDSKS